MYIPQVPVQPVNWNGLLHVAENVRHRQDQRQAQDLARGAVGGDQAKLNELIAFDPRSGTAIAEHQRAAADDKRREMQLATVGAIYEVLSAPDEEKPARYAQHVQGFKSLDPEAFANVPDSWEQGGYGFTINQLFDLAASKDPAMSKLGMGLLKEQGVMADSGEGSSSPSSLQELQELSRIREGKGISSITEEDYWRNQRSPQVVNLGGTQRVLGSGAVPDQVFDVTPKPEDQPQFKAAQTTAIERAKVAPDLVQGQAQAAEQLETAKQSGQAAVELQTEQQKKTTEREMAFKLYEAARDGLLSGLEGTETGPIAGRVPAFTTAQQTARGGVAAMAPVLKQLFRVAGEGVFTDRDQDLLIAMVPDRTDSPEARQAKIQNIDNIVRVKLGIESNQAAPTRPTATAQTRPQQTRTMSRATAEALARKRNTTVEDVLQRAQAAGYQVQ